MERMPWLTKRWSWKPMRFNAMLAGLAVGMGARISICREHVFPVATVGFEHLQ